MFVLGDDNSRKGKKNAAKVEGRRQEEEEPVKEQSEGVKYEAWRVRKEKEP